MTGARITTYRQFWPFYLGEHLDPRSRALHYLGTSAGTTALLLVTAGVLSPWFLPAAPALGYGPAWVGHFFLERNRPASFRYPLWSFVSDYRMLALALLGRLGPEVERAKAARAVPAGAA